VSCLTNSLLAGNKNWEVEVVSNGIMLIPNFVKIGSSLSEMEEDRCTHTQDIVISQVYIFPQENKQK
jgi:hypothetical protein